MNARYAPNSNHGPASVSLSPYAEASHYHDAGRPGYFMVLEDGRQRSYRLSDMPDVLANIYPDSEAFLSQAEFRCPVRRMTHLARLTTTFVDLDTQKSEYGDASPDRQAKALLIHCKEQRIPTPSAVSFSGRGLHVKWFYDSPIPAQALPRWNAVEKELMGRLAPFNPDRAARDATRCLRMPGTRNSRSLELARVLWQDERGGRVATWDFDDLAYNLLPFTREELQEAKRERSARVERRNPGRSVNLWSSQKLWWARLDDVRRLVDMRGWHGVEQGNRHNFLLVASLAVVWGAGVSGDKDVAAEIREIARELTPSLPPSEIETMIRSCQQMMASKTQYRMTNDRIIELLGVTGAEQEHLKYLRDKESRDALRAERKRRQNRKFSDRATYLEGAKSRRNRAILLRAEGKTLSEVAKELGVSTRSVTRYFTGQIPSQPCTP